jgi:hypothetical protein
MIKTTPLLLKHIREVVLHGRRPELIEKTEGLVYEALWLRGKAEYMELQVSDILGRGKAVSWLWNDNPSKAVVSFPWQIEINGDRLKYILQDGTSFDNASAFHPVTGMLCIDYEKEIAENMHKSPLLFYLAHENPQFLQP